MLFRITLSITLCIISLHAQSDNTEMPHQQILKSYSIFAEGENIGGSTMMSISMNQKISILQTSFIKVSGWWGKIDIKSSTFQAYTTEGTVLDVSSKVLDLDDMESYKVDLKLDSPNNKFVGEISSTKDISKESIIRINELSNLINQSNSKNPHPLKLKYFQNKLSLITDKPTTEKQMIEYSTQDFSTSINGLPFYIKNLLDRKEHWLNIIELDELKVDRTKLTFKGNENVRFKNSNIMCSHFILTTVNRAPRHLWIADLNKVIPYLVRYTWQDEFGENEIKLDL